MARPSARRSHSIGIGATRVAALTAAQEQPALRSSRLREHLIRDHGRTEAELNGLPLADLHPYEHVEQEMGLLELSHRHEADVRTHTHASSLPEEAPITAVVGGPARYAA